MCTLKVQNIDAQKSPVGIPVTIRRQWGILLKKESRAAPTVCRKQANQPDAFLPGTALRV